MGSEEIVEITDVPDAYLKEEGIRTLALHLRDDGNAAAKLSRHASLKSAHGGLEKRVVYFKGRDFVNFMMNKVTRNKVHKEWGKELKRWPAHHLPPLDNTDAHAEDTACHIGTQLIKGKYIFKARFFNKEASSKEKIVEAIETKDAETFTKEAIYVWVFEGKKFWSYFWSFAIPAVVILCCLMPLWPDFMKTGLWFVSVTLLLFTLGLTIVRFVIFLVLWLFGMEFWIFPNLFDESLSVVDSFKPFYSFKFIGKQQAWMRVLTLLGLASCVYWVMTHPGEWEKLQQDEAQFRADLYSGKFLSDAAKEWQNHVSTVKNKDDKYRHSFEEFERMSIEDSDSNNSTSDSNNSTSDSNNSTSNSNDSIPPVATKADVEDIPGEDTMKKRDELLAQEL